MALARSKPGAWVVRLPNEPMRLLRTVRERAAPELRLDDGVMEAAAKNDYRDDAGVRRGDIYLRFVPHGRLSEQPTMTGENNP